MRTNHDADIDQKKGHSPTLQTFGRCIFWQHWAGSQVIQGISRRIHKPAEEERKKGENKRYNEDYSI